MGRSENESSPSENNPGGIKKKGVGWGAKDSNPHNQNLT